MLVFTFGYLVGISSEMFLGQFVSSNVSVFIAIICLVTLFRRWGVLVVGRGDATCSTSIRLIQVVTIGLLAGGAVVWIHQESFASQTTLAEGEGYWMGQFIGLPSSNDYGNRWQFKAHQMCAFDLPDKQEPCTANIGSVINQKAASPEIVLELTIPVAGGSGEQIDPKSGQVWALPLNVRPALNAEQALQYQNWLRRENVVGKASVLHGLPSKYLYQGSTIDSARFSIRSALLNAHTQSGWATEETVIGLLLAITLGDRSLFDRDDWRLFTQTGTSHLVAISGFHLSLVFAVVYWFGYQLASLAPMFIRFALPQHVAFCCGALAATGYAALAGFALPTQRALMMILVVCLIRVTGVIQGWWMPLLVAICLILAWEPYAAASASLWMSVYAVAIILWVTTGRLGVASVWKSILYIQLAIGLGMVPISVFYFQQFSLSGLLINILAIPVIAWLILPLSLVYLIVAVACSELVSWLQPVLYWICRWFIRVLEWGAEWPLSVWLVPQVDVWMLLAGVAGVALLLTPKGFPMKALGIVFVIPLLAGSLIPPNISQIDAVVVATRKSFSMVIFSPKGSGESDWFVLDPSPGFDWQEARQFKRLFSLKGLPENTLDGFEPNLVYRWFSHSWALSIAHHRRVDILSPGLVQADLKDLCSMQSKYLLGSVAIKTFPIHRKQDDRNCVLSLNVNGREWLLLYHVNLEQQLHLLDTLKPEDFFDVIVLDNPLVAGALLNRFPEAEYVVRAQEENLPAIQRRLQARQLPYQLIDASGMVFAKGGSSVGKQKLMNQPYLVRESELDIRKYTW